jgi:hypothetical protein
MMMISAPRPVSTPTKVGSDAAWRVRRRLKRKTNSSRLGLEVLAAQTVIDAQGPDLGNELPFRLQHLCSQTQGDEAYVANL